MDHLQAMWEELGARGVVVFAISMADDPGEARRVTKERGWTFPIFDGRGSELGAAYAYG